MDTKRIGRLRREIETTKECRSTLARVVMDLRKVTPKGRRESVRQCLLVSVRRTQADYPKITLASLRKKALWYVRQSRRPLPWQNDPNWVNPLSTETYSACGYEDGLAQDREDAWEAAKDSARDYFALRHILGGA